MYRAVAALWLLIPPLAAGGLGQAGASVAADAAHFGAQVRMVPQAGYTIAELQAPGATLIREYESPAGLIFGISWRGAAMPDLRQLLGDSFAAYQQAAQAQAGAEHRRGPLHLVIGNLEVDNAGGPRAFQGRAVRLDLVPAQLSAAVVQ